jgi:hypothetical protein
MPLDVSSDRVVEDGSPELSLMMNLSRQVKSLCARNSAIYERLTRDTQPSTEAIMNELVGVFFAASAVLTPIDRGASWPLVPQNSVTNLQMSQAQMGQICDTPRGSCRIAPRPVKTQCFCGNVPGTVR